MERNYPMIINRPPCLQPRDSHEMRVTINSQDNKPLKQKTTSFADIIWHVIFCSITLTNWQPLLLLSFYSRPVPVLAVVRLAASRTRVASVGRATNPAKLAPELAKTVAWPVPRPTSTSPIWPCACKSVRTVTMRVSIELWEEKESRISSKLNHFRKGFVCDKDDYVKL